MRSGSGFVAATIASAAVCVSLPARAATFQVGPGKAHATLTAVAPLLGPGDLVEVDGDHTYQGGVVFQNAGTASQPITIRGVRINGKRPVLTGGLNTIEAQANHYVFEGLDLTAGTSRCFYHHAHDIVLRDSVVHDCPTHGILGADTDSGDLLLEYVEVHHCGGGTQHHQIYMATDETAYPGAVFRMRHCYVHAANGGNGVKTRAERNEIHYNWVEGSLYHELELIGPDGQDPGLAREDSDVVGNVLLKRNTFSVTRCGGDGTGETGGRYRFVNNTVVVLPGGSAVFRLFDSIESIEMHNNVFAVDGDGTVNLVRQVEAVWTTGSPVFAGSNNWVQTGSANVPQAWTGTLQGTDPGFLDLATNELHPVAGSVLIDSGSLPTVSPAGFPFPNPLAQPAFHPPTGVLEPVGQAEPRALAGAIDIGAYEFPLSGAGGSAGSGQGGASGQAGSGGSAGGGGSAGAGEGGAAGQGGTAGTSGAAGSAGQGGAAGSSAGGASQAGSSGMPDAGPFDGGMDSASPAGSGDEGGCGCRVAGDGQLPWSAMLIPAALWMRRRRTRRW